MPVVFRYRGVRFFLYSNEGNPREALPSGVIPSSSSIARPEARGSCSKRLDRSASIRPSDETDLMLALRTLSKVFGGVQEVARQADVNAYPLYRTLSAKGNPELKALSAILKARGMRLAIQPLNHPRQHHAHA